MAVRPRIIVALPDAIERATIAEWLSDNRFEAAGGADPTTAAQEMHARDFDLLVTEAAFAARDGLLAVSRERNPSTATVVIGNPSDDSRYFVSRRAIYMERPLDRATFLCTVLLAILEGRPARRSHRKNANGFEAIVNGVPSHIIDASHHGVRLQMPGRHISSLPSCFSVRVPLIGVGVTVQQIWARSAPNQAVIWCGATLSANRPAIEQGWRGFVDMLPVVGATSS